jgi:hypothetical protein
VYVHNEDEKSSWITTRIRNETSFGFFDVKQWQNRQDLFYRTQRIRSLDEFACYGFTEFSFLGSFANEP